MYGNKKYPLNFPYTFKVNTSCLYTLRYVKVVTNILMGFNIWCEVEDPYARKPNSPYERDFYFLRSQNSLWNSDELVWNEIWERWFQKAKITRNRFWIFMLAVHSVSTISLRDPAVAFTQRARSELRQMTNFITGESSWTPEIQPNEALGVVWLSFWCSARPSVDTGVDTRALFWCVYFRHNSKG